MLFKNLALTFRAAKMALHPTWPYFNETRLQLISPFLINNRKNTSTARKVPLAIHSSSDDVPQFLGVLPKLVRDLTDAGRHKDAPEATKWFAKVLEYNMPVGNNHRGLTVVTSYKLLMDKNLTEEGLFLAQVAGWCVEMLQACFAIQDDIEDESETRLNRPCWHRTHNLGVKAINDAFYLESAIYQLLRKYMHSEPYYLDLVELFHDLTYNSGLGQCLDIHCLTNDNRPNIELFTMDRYNAIVKYKTSQCTLQLPVVTAMVMAGVNDPELYRQVKAILFKLGNFYQVNNDYLDCFGDPEQTGKVGTDIKNGKCSWLIVIALQRANKHQRKIIKDCYGYSDPEKVNRIKMMYEELNIPAIYTKHENRIYSNISTQIQQISPELPHGIFFTIMNKIFNKPS